MPEHDDPRDQGPERHLGARERAREGDGIAELRPREGPGRLKDGPEHRGRGEGPRRQAQGVAAAEPVLAGEVVDGEGRRRRQAGDHAEAVEGEARPHLGHDTEPDQAEGEARPDPWSHRLRGGRSAPTRRRAPGRGTRGAARSRPAGARWRRSRATGRGRSRRCPPPRGRRSRDAGPGATRDAAPRPRAGGRARRPTERSCTSRVSVSPASSATLLTVPLMPKSTAAPAAAATPRADRAAGVMPPMMPAHGMEQFTHVAVAGNNPETSVAEPDAGSSLDLGATWKSTLAIPRGCWLRQPSCCS